MKKILFNIAAILLGCFMALVLLEVTFRFLPVMDAFRTQPVNAANRYVHYLENRDLIYSHGWNFSQRNRVHSNNYGYINDQDYTGAADNALISVIGDSFVEALMVPYRDTVQGRISASLGDKGRAYSFGISGAPLSQYLVFAELAKEEFNTDAMVFVVVINDFDQSLYKYKKAPMFSYFVEDKSGRSLTLRSFDFKPGHMRKLMRNSALVRYLFSNLQAHETLRRIVYKKRRFDYLADAVTDEDMRRVSDSRAAVDRFFELLPSLSGLPEGRILFVVDGLREGIYDDTRDFEKSYFNIMRDYFLSSARERSYETIDMQDVFLRDYRANGKRFEFDDDGHWNAYAHKLVFEEIQDSAVFSGLFK